jgi:hypothetical protein
MSDEIAEIKRDSLEWLRSQHFAEGSGTGRESKGTRRGSLARVIAAGIEELRYDEWARLVVNPPVDEIVVSLTDAELLAAADAVLADLENQRRQREE